MALFLVVFLAVYGSANAYVYLRAYQATEALPHYLKIVFGIVFWLGAAGYVLARVLDWDNALYDLLQFWGALWFAVILYAFLIVVFVDILRLVDHFFPFIPYDLFGSVARLKLVGFVGVLLLLIAYVGYGFYNANNIKVKQLELQLPKRASSLTELKVAFLSDTHFSPIGGAKRAEEVVRILEEIKPDLILMGGDIVDDKAHHLIRHEIDKVLHKIKAPLGVITINGNHEFINGYRESTDFIRKSGIELLTDSMKVIEGGLVILGREDRSINNFAGKQRATLHDLMIPAKKLNLPVIMMDHQPFNLPEAEAEGVDLQLSGHTHDGQLFPLNLIVRQVYELSYGYKKRGNTQYFVSSGAGVWGPPVRTGSDCEIIELKLKFK
ncbi:MAG: metallophosphoesterase [Ignavibacteriales bacterium]|nr:MAG: metallophosphoesterase [Ignavibacteriaceae bacterium]MBW7874129.1 metallophosphoesterase [Ignavibacteria bacterium]MCZ2142904.1 metallophosphoesterase [Ignavibacteriales bacterium]MBV6444542.1 hypothetical protein [Ignavibacteriaceae bacterium]MBZ0197931.1 metallophosphoesterase [Ignavibacteriaceae bacterium]